MLKDSTTLTKVFLLVAVGLGIALGLSVKTQPVSLSMLEIRLAFGIGGGLVLLMGLICILMCRRYDMNDDLMINEDDEEYYEYLQGNMKYYLSFSPVISLAIILITVFVTFHIEDMKIVFGVAAFLLFFFVVVPLFDILYTIFNVIRYNRE